MGDQETEYYWDEDSQAYYYWDEETQAYYPWVEEEGNQEGEVGGVLAVDEGSGTASPIIAAAVDSGGANNLADVESNYQPEPESNTENLGYQRDGGRALRRRYSFAEHGGLAGCLQLANQERLQRQDTVKLTDSDIKLEQQKHRVRQMLQESGLADEELLKKNTEDKQLPEHSGDGSQYTGLRPSAKSVSDLFSDLHLQSTSEAARELFSNKGREKEYRRRSTVRFGTSEFNDPTFQTKLEAMLSRNVKK